MFWTSLPAEFFCSHDSILLSVQQQYRGSCCKNFVCCKAGHPCQNCIPGKASVCHNRPLPAVVSLSTAPTNSLPVSYAALRKPKATASCPSELLKAEAVMLELLVLLATGLDLQLPLEIHPSLQQQYTRIARPTQGDSTHPSKPAL